ncbi:MAG: FRG domain-containing protein [Gemmatimonadota bacterium]
MKPGPLVAGSWTELQELLFAGSWNEQLKRFRASGAFRGSARTGTGLHTSLSHIGGRFAEREKHLIRNFRKYAHRSFVGDESLWNWLALAQHHGLPTRLLDWTYSPYVALHFVTADLETYGHDGEVWVVSFMETNRRLPRPLRALLEEEGSDVFTGHMLSRVAATLEEFDALSPEPFVTFLEPPSVNDRIVNQSALFSIMSHPEAVLHDWLARHDTVYRRIIIPAELKWEVRDKLDQANISERVLFPGLDGLSRWLKRYYTER